MGPVKMTGRPRSLDESGMAATEFALLVPILILLFLASVTVFNLYRTYQNVVQASGMVADMVSRTRVVDDDLFDNLFGVFNKISATGGPPGGLRITSIVRKGSAYSVDWVKPLGTASQWDGPDAAMAGRPAIADGDSMIVVESRVTYSLLSNITGMDKIEFSQTVFTRPRFIGEVVYDE